MFIPINTYMWTLCMQHVSVWTLSASHVQWLGVFVASTVLGMKSGRAASETLTAIVVWVSKCGQAVPC